MTQLNLEQISDQLDSSNSRDRLLALVSLREIAAQDALPLIKKVLYDEILPVRSMAVSALGVKKTAESYPCLLYTSPSPRDQRGSRMPSSA